MRDFVLIWSNVYNEEEHLEETIRSVLAQSHDNFKFLISDNYSTDKTAEILERYSFRDPRIVLIRPGHHLSGGEHGMWVFNEKLNEYGSSAKYSIHIGGHDFWAPDCLEQLLLVADRRDGCSIVYGSASEVDCDNKILKRYGGFVQSDTVLRALRPAVVLSALGHNVLGFGLFRESIRRRLAARYNCAGGDHLIVAEASLHGDLVHAEKAFYYLRRSSDFGDWGAYRKKHFSDVLNWRTDFARQLDWCLYLVRLAVLGDPFYSLPVISSLVSGATVQAYLLRYWGNLQMHENGLNDFFSDPVILDALRVGAGNVNSLSRFVEDCLGADRLS